MRRRILTVVTALAAMALLLAWSVSRPAHPGADSLELPHHYMTTTAPLKTSTQADLPAGKLLPDEFAIFQTRNAFSADGPLASGHEPEAVFVLRGVVKANEVFTAFIQNLGDKQMAQLLVGDAVARGHVKVIDLNSIQYESDGNSRTIAIGQTLSGLAAPPTSRPAAAPATPTADADGGQAPGGPLPPGMTPQMAAQIAAQMKHR